MTKISNGADRDSADQPRLSLARAQARTVPGLARRRVWVAAVPVFTLLIAILAVSLAPEIHETSPPLQTSAPRREQPSSRPVVARRTKAEEPLVRVNVTPGGVDSFQVNLRCRCTLIVLEKDETSSEKLLPSTFTVSSTKTGLKLDSKQYSTNQLEIQPEQSPAIRVDGHLYRGRIRLFRRTDGKVSAVNVVPIESYLASVVDSEMPANFPEAAREGQAIVARTYALYQIQQSNPNSVFDLLSSQRSQKYLGVEYLDRSGRRLAGESASSRNAVETTRGVICTRHKKLFCTYYSAVCGGQTTNGSEVFKDASDVVGSVPCDWCRDSPFYRWTTQMPREDFQKLVFKSGAGSGKAVAIHSIRQLSGPGSGQISRFEFDGDKQRASINGIELRERLPTGKLFSPHFRIQLETNQVVFEGRGHGHGVGFCQWGAKGQAEAGRSSLDIVRHYYPGAEITTLNY